MWRAMMGFIRVAVAVLSLLSVGQSAPVTTCEDLTQRIEITGREQLLGKWTLLAESTNFTGSTFLTKMFVESSWGEITAANESDAVNVLQVQQMMGRCFSLRTKLTLANSTLSMVQPFPASEVLLNTGCNDCLVFYSNNIIGGRPYRGLQFLSRRNKVTAAELEEFKKQVECVNLPPPAILDPEKGSCPSLTQETAITDLTSFMTDVSSDVVNLFDRILSSDTGLKVLSKIMSSSNAEVKEN